MDGKLCFSGLVTKQNRLRLAGKLIDPFLQKAVKTMNQEQEKAQQENKKISLTTWIPSGFIVICSGIIIYTVWKFNPGQAREFLLFTASILHSKQFAFVSQEIIRVIRKLSSETIEAVLVPISIYLIINIFIKSRLLKVLSYTTILCLLSLLASSYITHFSFNQIRLNLNFVKDLISFFGGPLTFVLNAYFFILLISPKVLWRIFSGAVIFVVGVILEIIPNVPILSQFGDISILTGLFSFLFFVLHTVAFLAQKLADFLNRKIHIPKLDFPLYSAQEQKSSADCKDNQKEQLTNLTPMNSKDAAQELE
ncbi:MAG: hypothetical protein ACRCU2_19735 [Planktothrix sp.]